MFPNATSLLVTSYFTADMYVDIPVPVHEKQMKWFSLIDNGIHVIWIWLFVSDVELHSS